MRQHSKQVCGVCIQEVQLGEGLSEGSRMEIYDKGLGSKSWKKSDLERRKAIKVEAAQ